MNTKVLSAILLIGIATWAGFTAYNAGNVDKNIGVVAEEIISTVGEQVKEQK